MHEVPQVVPLLYMLCILAPVTNGLLTLKDVTKTKAISRQLQLQKHCQFPILLRRGCDKRVVGHNPRTISQIFSFSFPKYRSFCFCKVTGAMLNHATARI